MSNRFQERLERGNRSDALARDKPSILEPRSVYPKIEAAQEMFAEDLEAVLLTDEGRRVIWYLLEESKVFDNTFDLTNSKAFIVNGKRSIGHIFWRVISGKLSHLLPQLHSKIKLDKESLKKTLEFRNRKDD